ncbi:MAG: hypothetical protein HN757_18155 [Calditrichaeota bacterium]|nr:hypothetical protein [Calditrichota bacterium]
METDTFLIFGKLPLPYNYSYETDKSLHAVAIGVDEKVLLELGYKNMDGFYVGVEPIIFPLISDIVFETAAGPRLLKSRYEEYYKLLGRESFQARPGLFQKSENQVNLQFKTKPTVIQKERLINRSYGSLGLLLEEYAHIDATEYLLAMNLLQVNHDSQPTPVDYGTLQKSAKTIYPEWKFTDAKLRLFDFLLVYSRHGTTQKEKYYADLFGEVGIRIFNWLKCFDKVLDEVEKIVHKMDRKAFIVLVFECYSKNTKADPVIKDIIEKILRVYDYDYTVEEIYDDIKLQEDHMLRDFLFGLEFFSRDPIDPKNISQLKSAVEYSQEHTSFAVALTLWGRTHGAFAIDPGKKLKMLMVYGEKNFCKLCLSDYPIELLEDVYPDLVQPNEVESAQSYLGESFWTTEGLVEDNGDFIQYSHKIISNGGLNLGFKTVDYFEDVDRYLKQVKNGEVHFNATELKTIIETMIPVSMQFDIGGEKIDFNVEYFDEKNMTLVMKPIARSKSIVPTMIVNLQDGSLQAWTEIIRGELVRRTKSAGMKREIRAKFLQEPDSKSSAIPKTVPQESTLDRVLEIDVAVDEAESLLPVPTMANTAAEILEYLKVSKIPLPSKRTKTNLLKAIEDSKNYKLDL